MKTRVLAATLGAVIAVLLSAGIAAASCGTADPNGYYEGTAQSKEAGSLKVAVNIRCDNGEYDGNIVTSAGTFTILGGSYSNDTLTLQFAGGSLGDRGTLTLHLSGANATGSFKLAADSGSFDLTRTGNPRAIVAATPDMNISKQQWHEDLQFLLAEISSKHVHPFEYTSRETLVNAAAALDARLGTLDPDQIYVGMDHIANLVGDGHTYVEFPPDPALFPIVMQRFGKDYRVVEATGDGRQALGLRVASIDHTPVQAAHDELVSAITPVGETDVLRDVRAQNFLSIGMALHGTGIIRERDRATYTFVNDSGKTVTLTLDALAPREADAAQWAWAWRATPPLFHQRPNEGFWYTYIAGAKAVYLSFRSYRNLATLGSRFIAFVNKNQTQKVIVDLRQNGGGDYKEGLKYVIDPLAALKNINRRGHLFVLIGPNTFSAAMSNAAQFRTKTQAILVGQTIGERPNSNQEANEERLPNSHLVLRYSTRHYTFLPGKIDEIVPDKEITPTWQQFEAGRDPVLEWALRFTS